MARKTLTFKSPNPVKLIALVYAICFLLYPSVRYSTSQIIHSFADLIAPES